MSLQSRTRLLLILILVLLAAILGLLYLIKGGFVPVSIMAGLALVLFSFAAVILFWSALSSFKLGLRRAYKIICVGIALYGIAQIQLPIILLFPSLSPLVNTGVIMVPYIAFLVLMFWGVRRFAHLIHLRTHWISWAWACLAALGVAGLVAAAASQLPTVSAMPRIAYIITLSSNAWFATILFFMTAGVVAINRNVSARYHRALNWMVVACAVLVSVDVVFIVVMLTLPQAYWEYTNIIALVASILFMRAGYTFAEIDARPNTVAAHATPIDVIVYIAGLASVPHDIDPMLDILRGVTATLKEGQPLPQAQELRLAGLYGQLEAFLVEHEPLRAFTRSQLREDVRTRFQFDVQGSSPFWKFFKDES